MSRSSRCRAQVEPLPALVGVAVVASALSLYAGAVPAVGPTTDRLPTEPTADRVVAALGNGSVAHPGTVDDLQSLAPDGFRLHVSLRTADRNWQTGPTPPDRAASAERSVPVRVGPGRVVPGRLTVVVWR